MGGQTNSRGRAATIGGLLLLCLIWASASLRADLLPGTAAVSHESAVELEALLLAAFAVLAGTGALVRKVQWPRGRDLGLTALVGAGLFVVPTVLVAFSREQISDSSRVALFSLTPVFAVVFEPYLGNSEAGQRGSLLAALAAVGGTLLVFPVELPQSPTSALAYFALTVSAASVAAANCAGVRIASGSISGFSFAAVAAGCAAACLGAFGAVFWHSFDASVPFDAWAALDLFALGLLFWLMRRMSAVRMTTRFLIAPLIANLIGLAFLRPEVNLRDWAGLLLIAMGAGWLLLAPEMEDDASALNLV
jgi:drug/metabolite transporter (DMT)-like permease